ncbi:hypothetical protein [Schleiferilactobacillus shenzhenensis]|uniref:Uncharacterized protein n=1 Tax=Schleiferilactobacillus shenzhenensis LY-73 TaxID=1231336 RepID=U4TJY9_9LACO|nr:hypothetical protein [Schleiferilactobacillus shenzhenensis]ERL65161.1 hypothetical protein L248_3099 [Schleiferilactobacillus shenzhenensis LY-73]
MNDEQKDNEFVDFDNFDNDRQPAGLSFKTKKPNNTVKAIIVGVLALAFLRHHRRNRR